MAEEKKKTNKKSTKTKNKKITETGSTAGKQVAEIAAKASTEAVTPPLTATPDTSNIRAQGEEPQPMSFGAGAPPAGGIAPPDQGPDPYPKVPFGLKLLEGLFGSNRPIGALGKVFGEPYRQKKIAMKQQDVTNMDYIFGLAEKDGERAMALLSTEPFADSANRLLEMDKDDIKDMKEKLGKLPISLPEQLTLYQAGLVEAKEELKTEKASAEEGQPGLAGSGSANAITDVPAHDQGQAPVVTFKGKNYIPAPEPPTAEMQNFENYKGMYAKDHPEATELDAYVAWKNVNTGAAPYGMITGKDGVTFYNKQNPKDNFQLNIDTLDKSNMTLKPVQKYGTTLGFWIVDENDVHKDEAGNIVGNQVFIPIKDIIKDKVEQVVAQGEPVPSDPSELRDFFENIVREFWSGLGGDEGTYNRSNDTAVDEVVEEIIAQQSEVDQWIGG